MVFSPLGESDKEAAEPSESEVTICTVALLSVPYFTESQETSAMINLCLFIKKILQPVFSIHSWPRQLALSINKLVKIKKDPTSSHELSLDFIILIFVYDLES